MRRSGIVLIIGFLMVTLAAGVPAVYADDTINQSAAENPGAVQLPMGQSAFSVASGDGSMQTLKTSAESAKSIQSYALKSATAYTADSEGLDWQKMVGGTWGEGFFDLQPTNDGNFVAAGASGSWDIIDENTGKPVPGYVNQLEAYIVKIDPTDGHILWHKLIGGNGKDGAMSIRQTADDGYIFAGSSDSADGAFANLTHGNIDGWVVKLNPDRTIKWQVLLGGSQNEELMSVRETANKDGYIVAGYTTSDDIPDAGTYGGNTDIYVAKLDLTGQVVWQKVIGGDKYDFASSIIPASDGGYILAGYTQSNSVANSNSNHGYNDIVIMKLDDNGNIIWSKLLGGEQGEVTAYDNIIQQTPDGYVLIGQTISSRNMDVTGNTHGSGDVWFVLLNTNGEITGQNLLGGAGYDDGTAIQRTANGEYIVVGRTQSSNSGNVGSNNGDWDIWAVKLDKDGKLLWQDALGGSGYEQCTAIQPTSDEGFIIAAFTKSSVTGNIGINHGYEDGWLAKLKPRLVVDVEDVYSKSWVPNVTVILHDVARNQDINQTAMINGRVVFTSSGTDGEIRFIKNINYTVKATAEYYRDSGTKSFVFAHDGQIVSLNQTRLIAPTDNSFSITCVENYDHICGNDGICSLSGSIDECNNVASALVAAGYNMSFYHNDGEVTEKDFATDPSYTGHMLTESAFHYHSGHGIDPLHAGGLLTGTVIALKDYESWKIPLHQGGVVADDVKQKWGGKTKWIAIQSCNILKDENWKNALTKNAHGILGYSTSTGVNSSFSKTFMKYALDKNNKMTIVTAYRQATIETWYDDNVIATVITRTQDQYLKDQFPGFGDMAPDAGPNDNNQFIKHWKCRSGVEW